MLPRSIIAWFVVCWGLFLVAALVVGAMLVALYKETTTQRTDRATTSIARACDAIVREAGLLGTSDRNKSAYETAVDRALTSFPGVEGGVWQSGQGSLVYAYPTYEGSGQKTDLPQAEEPTIQQGVETSASAHRRVDWKRDSRSQMLLISACPLADTAGNITGWAMTRVVTVGGRPFLFATTGLGFLLVVLLGSAALLGRVLWRWSQRLRAVEAALAVGAEDLPVLEFTGQRDLDRIIGTINGAGAKASKARRRTVGLLRRVAEGERLAALGRDAVVGAVRRPRRRFRCHYRIVVRRQGRRSRIRRADHYGEHPDVARDRPLRMVWDAGPRLKPRPHRRRGADGWRNYVDIEILNFL